MPASSVYSADTTVTVAAMALSVTVVNSTTITAIAPAHAAGPADVVVTNPSGSGGTLTAAFAGMLARRSHREHSGPIDVNRRWKPRHSSARSCRPRW